MLSSKKAILITTLISLFAIGLLIFASTASGRTVLTQLFWGTSNGADIFNVNSGNVGIGTTTPIDKLTIKGGGSPGQEGVTILDGYLQIFFNQNTGTPIGGKIFYDTATNIFGIKTTPFSNTPLSFATNGNERMRIDASGNVGINNNNPLYTLDVNGVIFGGMPLMDIAIESTNANQKIGLIASAAPLSGDVYIKYTEGQPISLGNASVWSDWINFGQPSPGNLIVDISVSISLQENSNYRVGLMTVKTSDAKIYARNIEGQGINLANPSLWSPWTYFGDYGV